MYPATPPISSLSRPKLKRLAAWIRDDLDLLVAREGPDVLRPDDVLILHETFIALRHADDITPLDLRATGIHRAVQDIAGFATRWPSRLCDDCDKIITVWTVKFGSLRNIHPFLYGRGGRLEGVASRTEYSSEALLQRWTMQCPDKIHPRRSHRLGSLGFRAGAWWINPLFAYHAGIIGLESLEGGTTYDKHGAYALLLKDTGEVEASSMEQFTYRCLKRDKGKFRLTSATPRSREPIRVLRSHSINSVWGPKAGVRYEGLYSVQGWSIRAAKSTDFVGGEWREGDIIFEIKFERADVVDMQEVIKHPTAAELDDYSEYKRIRKATRDGKRKGITIRTHERNLEPGAIIPPPLQPIVATKNPTLDVMRSGSSRKSLFKRPYFNKNADLPLTPGIDVVSPMTIPDADHFNFAPPSKRSTLAIPAQPNIPPLHKSDSSPSDPSSSLSPETLGTGSGHTAGTQPHIREVAPWIDYDVGLALPPPDQHVTIVGESIVSQDPNAIVGRGKAARVNTQRRTHYDSSAPGASNNSRISSDFRHTTRQLSPSSTRKQESRKSVLARSNTPIAKLFDGTKDGARDQEPDDYFGDAVASHAASINDTPMMQDEILPQSESDREQASSASDTTTTHIHSPLPMRHFDPDSPMSPLSMSRRDGICPPTAFGVLFPAWPKVDSSAVTTMTLHNEPSTDASSESPVLPSPIARSLPVSLERVMTRSMRSVESGNQSSQNENVGELGSRFGPEGKERKGGVSVLNVKVEFTDPFGGEGMPRRGRRRESSNVAPDVVD